MPESRFRIRHHHDGIPAHEHYWTVGVDSAHPDAHKVLLHAFRKYVSDFTRQGAMFVDDYRVEDIRMDLQRAVVRFLELDVPVRLVEE